MNEAFLKKVAIEACVLCALATAVCLAAGRSASWALALWVGAAWIFINVWLLGKILALALGAGPKKRDGILTLAVLKFPVLYVAGYFLLATRVFPVLAVLAGLGIFLGVFSGRWLMFNLRSKTLESFPT